MGLEVSSTSLVSSLLITLIFEQEAKKILKIVMQNLFKIILATNVFNELLKKLSTNNIDLVILS